MRRLTRKQLRRWRTSQRHVVDGSPLTQARAAAHLSVSLRAWQHYEGGTRKVPRWLSRWIRERDPVVPGYSRPLAPGAPHG